MKKLFFTILLVFAIATSSFAAAPTEGAFSFDSASTTTTVAACNTIVPAANTRLSTIQDGGISVGEETGRYNVGQIIVGAEHTICKVSWRTASSTGDVSGKVLYSQIWTMNGTALDTMVEESSNTYLNPQDSTTYEFIHNHVIGSGYAVIITTKSVDASNYVNIGLYVSDQDSGYSYYGRWYSNGTQGSSIETYDTRGQLYE